MSNNPSALTVTCVWDEHGKRWRVTTVLRMGRGVSSHWRWADTRQEIEAPDAAAILDAVIERLEGKLPY